MASNIKISTGLKNALLGSQSIFEVMRGGKIILYSGTVPDTADAAIAAGNTALCTITRASLTSAVAQVMTITPSAGDQNASSWAVTVNGNTVVFVDDGTPTPTEVCLGLYNALLVLAGGAITTPASTMEIATCHDKFTVTNNTTTLDITSAAAGTPIDVTSAVSGGTGSTGTLVTTTNTADACGINLDLDAIASGVIVKDTGEVWSGVADADGTVTFFRYVQYGDTGVLSTTEERIQGIVSTSNAPLIIRNVNVYDGATVTVDTFSITT